MGSPFTLSVAMRRQAASEHDWQVLETAGPGDSLRKETTATIPRSVPVTTMGSRMIALTFNQTWGGSCSPPRAQREVQETGAMLRGGLWTGWGTGN